jgi:hypothetical protein
LQWEFLESGLRDAISAIIRSTSLEKLHITHVNMPITFFQGIHVKKLILYIQPDHFCRQGALLQAAAPEGGATTASHTVVDHCEWNCSEPLDGTTFPLQIRSFFLTK